MTDDTAEHRPTGEAPDVGKPDDTAAVNDTAAGSLPSLARDAAVGVGSAVVAGAIQGAVVGGAAGAAGGAAKSAAWSLLQDQRVRRAVITGAIAALTVVILIVTGSAVVAAGLISSIGAGRDQNTAISVSNSGVDDATARHAEALGEQYRLPWPLVLAILQRKPDADIASFAGQVNTADPASENRDLAAGAVYQFAQRAMTIPTSGDGRVKSDAVTAVYTTALTAFGFSAPEAAAIVNQARSWALGEDACAQQASAASSTPQPSSSAGTQIGGRSWTDQELANARTVIGLSKAMFADDAEKAAVIALMVAVTESGLRNLANDGVVGPEDGSVDTSSYPELAYSLTLPNDGVGSDHASLGIMQQQAVYSWGEWQTSTWSSDPHGVIGRLMNPAYAAGKFLTVMNLSVPNWRTADNAAVAQSVQVSGPDAYSTSSAVAEALWASLSSDSPPVAPPVETGWAGAGTSGSSSAASCSASSVVSGDKRALANWILTSGKVLFLNDDAGYESPRKQLEMVAAGDTRCNLNLGILQLISVAANAIGQVTISSLNRNNDCTGTDSTSIAGSYHSIQGGGHAVDFAGPGATGADPTSMRIIAALLPYLPARAGTDPYYTFIGQSECRSAPLNLPAGVYEGNDTCNHLHVNISPAYNDTGLPNFDPSSTTPTPKATP
ncbi:hypothetical protein [Microbacterium sp. 4NA327F11]|uniref:hypothetical protein n=1 Tax=Microbacterium sp. 4NA327F11 TaxID=2502229 RepID=UPI0010F92423|nr:hypothetical protein [Microbacterium sp. 4NA327F11]